MVHIQMAQSKYDKQIALWLFTICAMVFLMIILGGITRLTESGLSMVTWKPLSGILPPIGEIQWAAEFKNYQNYPEYKIVNEGMSLAEFKAIFYWEYSHRILGRLIGIAFFIPFMIFLFQKKIKDSLMLNLIIMFILGGCQGFLGWWMVKSGLVNEPDVSHYRLTAHLGLAVLIYVYMFWVALGLVKPIPKFCRKKKSRFSLITIKLIFLQILLGALVAGKNAGRIHTDWPLMDGQIIPEGLMDMSPWYMNFFENIMTIQFDHRILGYLILILSMMLWFKVLKSKANNIVFAANLYIFSIFLQVSLGIMTLMTGAILHPAVMHQAGAIFALSAGIYLHNRIRAS